MPLIPWGPPLKRGDLWYDPIVPPGNVPSYPRPQPTIITDPLRPPTPTIITDPGPLPSPTIPWLPDLVAYGAEKYFTAAAMPPPFLAAETPQASLAGFGFPNAGDILPPGLVPPAPSAPIASTDSTVIPPTDIGAPATYVPVGTSWPIGPPNIWSIPGSSAVADALGLKGLKKVIDALTSPTLWVRIGEMALGVLLLVVGLYLMVSESNAGQRLKSTSESAAVVAAAA